MTQSSRGRAAYIDIDELLQDTWLQVVSLRYGPQFKEGDGRKLWERCVADIEHVQQQLQQQGLDEVGCQHILTAQCALLDEAVKGRGVMDDACVQWYDVPLQGHFLGTLDAGDTLSNRMQAVLRESSPDAVVLTCFQRVMMLGFLGNFSALDSPERSKLVQALNDRVLPFSEPKSVPIWVNSNGAGWIYRGLRNGRVQVVVSLLVVAAIWWGLDQWLNQLLLRLLPGTVP